MKKNKAFPRQNPKPTRVVLVDDHPLVRERLTEVIQAEPGYIICGEAEDRLPALDVIATTQPDIVMVDLVLKNSNGLELIKDIHARWPELRMLVVSMHDESVHAERALRAGAHGYITKQEATRSIMSALETVRKGEVYLSEKVAMNIARQTTARSRAKSSLPMDQLSDRELQVFQLLGRGRTRQEIAAELKVEPHTIETYRSRIKVKLNLKNGGELLQHAIQWNQFGGGM
jgi:DNA-binding NarL/FixJ family response regulator